MNLDIIPPNTSTKNQLRTNVKPESSGPPPDDTR